MAVISVAITGDQERREIEAAKSRARVEQLLTLINFHLSMISGIDAAPEVTDGD